MSDFLQAILDIQPVLLGMLACALGLRVLDRLIADKPAPAPPDEDDIRERLYLRRMRRARTMRRRMLLFHRGH